MIDIQTQMLVAASTETVKQPISILFNSWIKPKVEKYFARKKVDDMLLEQTYELFFEYLKRTYDDNSSINVLAIGNQQVLINQVYQPLTIGIQYSSKYLITGYPAELATKYKRILIEDQAGMGKSTLMKKMFISSIEENVGIPVFIELRKLSSNANIIDHIIETVNSVDASYNKELIMDLIKRGDFIFF